MSKKLIIELDPELSEVAEMVAVLNRAANSWEPKLQPPWLLPLIDTLDRRLAGAPIEGRLNMQELAKQPPKPPVSPAE